MRRQGVRRRWRWEGKREEAVFGYGTAKAKWLPPEVTKKVEKNLGDVRQTTHAVSYRNEVEIIDRALLVPRAGQLARIPEYFMIYFSSILPCPYLWQIVFLSLPHKFMMSAPRTWRPPCGTCIRLQNTRGTNSSARQGTYLSALHCLRA